MMRKKRCINKFILLVFISCFITFLPFTANSALQKIGVVGAANQSLSAIGGNKETRQLKLGDDIFLNDTIITNTSGKAQLLFLDKSALNVGPNSSIVVDKFVYNPAESGGEFTMRSTKGAFRFIGGALSKKQEVKLKTPVGTIGIRGGIFQSDTNPTTGATTATYIYGEQLSMTNSQGVSTQVTDQGYATSLASATSIPTAPKAVDVSVIAKDMQNFLGTIGQSGGASAVPSTKDIEKTNVISDSAGMQRQNNNSNQQQPNDPANQQGGDNKQNGQGQNTNNNNNQQGQGSGDNKQPVNNNQNNNQGSNSSYNNGNNTAAAGNNQGGNAMPRDPGVLTNDGGYIDAQGNKRSASDLATYRREQATTTGNSNNASPTATYNGPGQPNTVAAGYHSPAMNNTTNGGYYATGTAAGAPGSAAAGYNNTGSTYYGGGAYMNNNAAATSYTGAANTYNNTGGMYNPGGGGYYGGTAATPTAGNYNTYGSYNQPAAPYTFITYGVTGGTSNVGGTNYYNPTSNMIYNVYNPLTGITTSYTDPNAAAVAQAAIIASQTTAGNNYNNSNVDFNAMQTAQNVAINTNVQTFSGTVPKYSMDNIALPVGNVSSSLIEQRNFASKDSLKTDMTTNKAQHCNNCNFVNWDVWANVIPDTTSVTASTVQAKVVPYVFGSQTTTIPGTVPSPINATYNGATTINVNNGGTITSQQGTISASITLNGSATLTGLSFNVPQTGGSLSLSGGSVGIGTTFNGISVAGGGFTGTVNGALFGPSAENIGGNMNFSGNGMTGAGVYVGGR